MSTAPGHKKRKQPLRRIAINPEKRRAAGRKRGRGTALAGARMRLRYFKQATIVAVALTAFLLLLFGDAGMTNAQHDSSRTNEQVQRSEAGQPALSGDEISEATKNEALSTLQNLRDGFYSNLPKVVVALATLILAWGISRIMRFTLRKSIGRWKSSGAIIALTSIIIWALAAGIAVSVLAGDIRALIGSLGLVGLALSWALQTPIESFTGWLLNSFKRYYKIGDRIQVGDVFGDVYKIDFLTTTIWEIGAPYRQGFVMAEQPTGRLVTFPNNEILSGSIVNLTGDFPYVYDELSIAVANESDIRYAMEVVKKTATAVLGDYMKEPAQRYDQLLRNAGLTAGAHELPQVFVSASESWTEIIVRYLTGFAERRKWKSELTIRIAEVFSEKEHAGKIKPVYPRWQVQFINDKGEVR